MGEGQSNMAFDEALAARLRRILAARTGITERKMMGGLCFMVGEHMCCGVLGSALMVRVGRDAQGEVLRIPHVRKMEMSGRQVSGFILVDAAGLRSDAAISKWIERGIAFASTLSPKRR